MLGTAGIGRKNWMSIYQSGNGQVAGVASRNQDKAQAYIDECQRDAQFTTPPVAFGSYQSMLDSDQIDAVYIPLPTGTRKEWVIAAAQAGKHILCEKPCAINADDLAEMLDVCRENQVQFMDGVMFMHSQRLPQVLDALQDTGRMGQLNRIAGQFSFRAPDEFFRENIRSQTDLEPHGCLGDLGWYLIRFALLACDNTLPTWVSARTLKQQSDQSPIPTDYEFSLGFLKNQQQVTTHFYCSFLTHHQQWVHCSGTEGTLRVQDFVLPYEGNQSVAYSEVCDFQQNGCHFIMKFDQQTLVASEASHAAPDAQEARMFARMGQIVASGQTESYWPEIAMKTQQIMDACRMAEQTPGQRIPWNSLASQSS